LYGNNNSNYFGALDASSTRDGAGPSTEPYWGSGNSTNNYDVFVNHAKNIELGLKIHEYRGSDVAPVGDGDYDVAAGASPLNANRSTWNFDYSINTGVEGGHKTLDAFDFRITITSGDANEVAVLDLIHLGAGNTPFHLVGGGLADGFADEDGSNAQIAQNSVNLGFGFLKAVFGADFQNAGESYTIKLEAFEGHKLIGVVQEHVDLV